MAIAIVGTGEEAEPAIYNAREVGRMAADLGWVVITGGRNAGVMRAAVDGAKTVAGGLAIGILPDSFTESATSLDATIITGTGEARNNVIVLSSSVVIACGADDPGTVSEVALAIKNSKPVVLLGVSKAARDFFAGIAAGLVQISESPAEAIEIARRYAGPDI